MHQSQRTDRSLASAPGFSLQRGGGGSPDQGKEDNPLSSRRGLYVSMAARDQRSLPALALALRLLLDTPGMLMSPCVTWSAA